MKKLFISTLILIFILISIAQAKIIGKVTKRYINSKIKEITFIENEKLFSIYEVDPLGVIKKKSGEDLNGQYKVFHGNGNRAAEMNFVNGKVNELAVFYFKIGTIEAEYTYKDGYKAGPYKIFYNNGIVQQEGIYISYKKNNAEVEKNKEIKFLTGKFRVLKEEDTLEALELAENKKIIVIPNGEVKSYGRDGRLEYIDTYENGKLISTKAFDRTGKKVDWERKY